MIKWFLFLFFYSFGFAYNASDCRKENNPNWFCDYMHKHGKVYNPSNVEFHKTKLQSVKTHVDEHGVHWGLTSRSDKNYKDTNYALKIEKHLYLQRSNNEKHIHLGAPPGLPPIDWRNNNGISYVTSVKDQGDCGGCFAFASATILEFWSRKNGHPKSLSVQAIMDCTSGYKRPDDGCDGGLMEYVFEYAKNRPIPLETEVPWQEKDTKCPRKLWSYVEVKDYKVLMHSENNKAESEIEWLLHTYGPVSVGIDSTTMDNYRDGIFRAHMCTTDIDHAVTIIGYTKDAWIIKNSWGPFWGHKGYLYLERGKNACGIAEYIVYVTNATPIHKKENTKWSFST